MKREEMTAIVNEELEHIPKKRGAQNVLRAAYNAFRRNGLGGKPEVPSTAMGAIECSLAAVRKQFPDAELTFDAAFFASR
jgi:hypothetical protein